MRDSLLSNPLHNFPVKFTEIEFRLSNSSSDLEFIPHPVLNGFYALGKRTDIVKMKAAVAELDVSNQQEIAIIRYSNLDEARSLLKILVPGVTASREETGEGLRLTGSPAALEQAKELIDQLDLPLGPSILECKLLRCSDLPVEWRNNWDGRVRETGETVPLRCGRLQLAPENRAFLIASSESHVLASPRVALQSGDSAQIHIGDKHITDGTYQDVGLSLTSTITIQEDNLNCCLAGEFVIPDGSPSRTRTLTFDGHVELKNHETLVLEGLLSPEEARAAVTAVPLLARLPVLGDLFRHSPSQESLWVVVTPELMK